MLLDRAIVFLLVARYTFVHMQTVLHLVIVWLLGALPAPSASVVRFVRWLSQNKDMAVILLVGREASLDAPGVPLTKFPAKT